MDNLDTTKEAETSQPEKNSGPLIIGIAAVIVLTLAVWQFATTGDAEPVIQPIVEAPVEAPEPVVEVAEEPLQIEEVVVEIPIIEPITEELIETQSEVVIEEVIVTLPALDDSDEFIKVNLPELTWRNELLSLFITDDIIRRFVVFTDNFAQGLLAYDHSLFIKPTNKFSVDEKAQSIEGKDNVWRWDTKTSQRFDLYVDLLRSVDSSTLVDLYVESKPLIDEAYAELGYEEDFTYTLQDAITRVLDMNLPQSSMDITRSSVMYKFQDTELESLDDSDKLLLRIGKENLLIIKSVLLEVNEKLEKRASLNS